MVPISTRVKDALAKTEGTVKRRASKRSSRKSKTSDLPSSEPSEIEKSEPVATENFEAGGAKALEPPAEKLANVEEEIASEAVQSAPAEEASEPLPEPLREPLPEAEKVIEPKPQKLRTLTADEAEPWQRNWYIHSGYRPELKSYKKCIYSIVGYIHNESVNIWSHLFGAAVIVAIIVFLAILFAPGALSSIQRTKIFEYGIVRKGNWHWALSKKKQAAARHWINDWQDWLHIFSWKVSQRLNTEDVLNPSPPKWINYFPWLPRLWVLSKAHVLSLSDKVAVIAMLAGGLTCLGTSTAFHTFCAHSFDVSTFYNRADFGSIVLMIYGSTVALVHNGLYCHPKEKIAYWVMATVSSLICAKICLDPRSTQPTYRRIRSFSFVALGVSEIIPAMHMVYLQGFTHMWSFFRLDLVFGGGLFYIFGAVMYAERYPEKAWPGKFDLFLNSHHFLHFTVLIAAAMHFEAFLEGFLNVHSLGYCSS